MPITPPFRIVFETAEAPAPLRLAEALNTVNNYAFAAQTPAGRFVLCRQYPPGSRDSLYSFVEASTLVRPTPVRVGLTHQSPRQAILAVSDMPGVTVYAFHSSTDALRWALEV